MATAASDTAADLWADRIRQVLAAYDEPLLRQVAHRLLKPRNHWPVDELVERAVATLGNAVAVDRKIKELPPGSRRLLAVIGLSRQPHWRVGHLLAILATLGESEGLTPVQALLETGLLYPELPAGSPPLKAFDEWLGGSGVLAARLFAHPDVVARVAADDLGLPELTPVEAPGAHPRAADGLEWLLRMAVVWQQVSEGPLRLTQQQSLFKRDLSRLQTDELLNAPFAEQVVPVPDAGLFALVLASATGLLALEDGEMKARPFPPAWDDDLGTVLRSLWAALPTAEWWDPMAGWMPVEGEPHPFPSLAPLAFLALSRLPAGAWADPAEVGRWLYEKHPSWRGRLGKGPGAIAESEGWARTLLLGVGFPMRLTDAVETPGGWMVRLSDFGRHLLCGAPEPALGHDFRQTLLVQPSCEVVAYRQGLTPALVSKLTRFARWKVLGAACILELEAASVYHGLESGLSLAELTRVLQQHGMRPVPPSVADLLQRWANKRERITLYHSATLLEFATPADLDQAVSRGLVALKLTDRIGLVDDGEAIDYRHFRLTGNRDYESKPQRCLQIDPDGVTFAVDAAQSDLLLEAELGRIAEPVSANGVGPRRYQLTPKSLRTAAAAGLSVGDLDQWFVERGGQPLSSAGRLLFQGAPPARALRQTVVYLPNEEAADGVVQWPATARWVEERLGPTAVVVAEENLEPFRAQLAEIGVELKTAEE
jgi:hypothetical protein